MIDVGIDEQIVSVNISRRSKMEAVNLGDEKY